MGWQLPLYTSFSKTLDAANCLNKDLTEYFMVNFFALFALPCLISIHIHLFPTSDISLFTYLQKNHLSGLRKTYLKLSFDTVQELMNVKSELVHVVENNWAKSDAAEAYDSILFGKR